VKKTKFRVHILIIPSRGQHLSAISLSKNLNTSNERASQFKHRKRHSFRHAGQINAMTLFAVLRDVRKKKERTHRAAATTRSACLPVILEESSAGRSAWEELRRADHSRDPSGVRTHSLRSRRHSSCVSFEGNETRIPSPPSRNANSVPWRDDDSTRGGHPRSSCLKLAERPRPRAPLEIQKCSRRDSRHSSRSILCFYPFRVCSTSLDIPLLLFLYRVRRIEK